jgi:hypothetical protein
MKPSCPLELSVNEELQQLYFRRTQITEAIQCLENLRQMRSTQTISLADICLAAEQAGVVNVTPAQESAAAPSRKLRPSIVS